MRQPLCKCRMERSRLPLLLATPLHPVLSTSARHTDPGLLGADISSFGQMLSASSDEGTAKGHCSNPAASASLILVAMDGPK